MSPELEEILATDSALSSEIASLKRNLEGVERELERAKRSPRGGLSWKEFFAFLLIATLLLNAFAIHMGDQLGWWDTNALVEVLDARLVALQTFESEVAPLRYGAYALAWFGTTVLTIFFAYPYQFLTLVAQLLDMVLPAAKTFLPYVEGAIVAFFLLRILMASPLVQGPLGRFRAVGGKDVRDCKRRIREIKRQIEAKEAEHRKLPADKIEQARELERQERMRREAEERQRKEAERQRREVERQRWEAERQRKEAEERKARERTDKVAMKGNVAELYEDDDVTLGSFFDGPDMLILGWSADEEAKLAEVLRMFCPDDRRVFESKQMGQALERLRDGYDMTLVLLVSGGFSKERLCWFLGTSSSARQALVLQVEDYAWINEEGAGPIIREFTDVRSGVSGLELYVNRLDVNGLEAIYAYSPHAAVGSGSEYHMSEDTGRRFIRYRIAASRAQEGWHFEGDTLVLDGAISTADGRAPWAERSLLLVRVEARDGADILGYDAARATFFPEGRMEGLFEGCHSLRSADLRKLRVGGAHFEELVNTFDACPLLDEVYVPDNFLLTAGLWKNGFERMDGDCWRPAFLPMD